MKRLLFLFLMCLPMMAVAQGEVEMMTSNYVKADPMTKMQGSTKWQSQHIGVTKWDDGRVGMGLMNPPHIFVTKRAMDGSRLPTNTCKVGLYTPDGTLVWLAEKWKCQPGEGGTILYFTGDSKTENQQTGEKRKITTADILKWLSQKGNYIRYIADVYGDYYWDVSGQFAEE